MFAHRALCIRRPDTGQALRIELLLNQNEKKLPGTSAFLQQYGIQTEAVQNASITHLSTNGMLQV